MVGDGESEVQKALKAVNPRKTLAQPDGSRVYRFASSVASEVGVAEV